MDDRIPFAFLMAMFAVFCMILAVGLISGLELPQ